MHFLHPSPFTAVDDKQSKGAWALFVRSQLEMAYTTRLLHTCTYTIVGVNSNPPHVHFPKFMSGLIIMEPTSWIKKWRLIE
jgi:hypothetical protein